MSYVVGAGVGRTLHPPGQAGDQSPGMWWEDPKGWAGPSLLLSRFKVGGKKSPSRCIWASCVLLPGLAGHGEVPGMQSGAGTEAVLQGAGTGAAHPEAEAGMFVSVSSEHLPCTPSPPVALAHVPCHSLKDSVFLNLRRTI